MNRLKSWVKRANTETIKWYVIGTTFHKEEKGDFIQNALWIAGILLVCVVVIFALGNKIAQIFNNLLNQL